MGRYSDDSDERRDRRRGGGRSRDDSSDERDKRDKRGRRRDDDEDRRGNKDKAKDKAKDVLDDLKGKDGKEENKDGKLKDTGGRSGPQAAKPNPCGNMWYFQNDPSLAKACLNSQLQFPQDYQAYGEEESKKLSDAYNSGRDICDLGKWIIYFNQTVDANSVPRRLIPAPGEHVQVRQGTDQPLEKFRAITLPSNWNPGTAPPRPPQQPPPAAPQPQIIQVPVPVEVPVPAGSFHMVPPLQAATVQPGPFAGMPPSLPSQLMNTTNLYGQSPQVQPHQQLQQFQYQYRPAAHVHTHPQVVHTQPAGQYSGGRPTSMLGAAPAATPGYNRNTPMYTAPQNFAQNFRGNYGQQSYKPVTTAGAAPPPAGPPVTTYNPTSSL